MAILATEKVLTLDWWKPASKLVIGDYVFDKDGKIVRSSSFSNTIPNNVCGCPLTTTYL